MTTLGNIFLGEFLGTAVLILLGNGVVANVTFKKTLGKGGGLIAITFGWALGVFAGVAIANIWDSGGFINPAVTMGQWVAGKIGNLDALIYILAQFLGALVGQIVLDIFYLQHIKDENVRTVLGMHSTIPTHKNIFTNLFSEYIGTIILISIVFYAILNPVNSSWFGGAPYAVALVVLSIGLSLGGTTGYAINPARDLSPRFVHWVMYKAFRKHLNISQQITSNWNYAWIPVVAPLVAGATIGGLWRIM